MTGGRLPNLLIAGVPKAGTSSLFSYLTQHPSICGGDTKEIGFLNFYDPRRHMGEPPPVEQYMAHFRNCGGEQYAIDATPSYSYGGRPVVQAAQRLLPAPKVILTLRDPVDRLWSAYTFQRSHGNNRSTGSFEAYLDACERRSRDAEILKGDHLQGLAIGFYSDYVGEWLTAFGDDLRVVFAEDMRDDRLSIVHGLFRWLGLDPNVVPTLDLTTFNPTKHPRSTALAKLVFSLKRSGDRVGAVPARARKPLRHAYEQLNSGKPPKGMSSSTRAHVEELYRPSNQAVARMLSEHGYSRLPHWLQVALPPSSSAD